MAKKLWSTKAHETPEFVEFWKTWLPRARDTDGRGLARDTFLEHVQNGADAQDMVDGAKWLIRNFKDFQYLPLSSTWLNRKAYEDYAEQYRAYEARRQERQRSQEQSTNVVSIDPDRRAEMAAKARALVGGVKLQEA